MHLVGHFRILCHDARKHEYGGGRGLIHRPYEGESELSEQCVQTAGYRAWQYVVATVLMKIIDRPVGLESCSL